jgi:ferredoxin
MAEEALAVAVERSDPDLRRFVVTVEDESGAAAFSCTEDEAVLLAMERSRVRAIPIGCRGGGCGFCRVRVLSGMYRTGRMSREHGTEEDQRRGFALACRLHPLGELRLALATEVKAALRGRGGGR